MDDTLADDVAAAFGTDVEDVRRAMIAAESGRYDLIRRYCVRLPDPRGVDPLVSMRRQLRVVLA